MSSQTDETVEEFDSPTEGFAALTAYTRGYFARVRGGELGSLPALAGLVVLLVRRKRA